MDEFTLIFNQEERELMFQALATEKAWYIQQKKIARQGICIFTEPEKRISFIEKKIGAIDSLMDRLSIHNFDDSLLIL